ncbi:MAG: hypothetical protein JO100_02465 [Pseudonocardia sp.]|nr:hypothetical protein [Pseudonocardia sp.]
MGFDRAFARRLLLYAVVIGLLAGSVVWLYWVSPVGRPPPGCTVTLVGDSPGGEVTAYPMTVEQADNAATIAAVGHRLGMPDHAVSVAVATALQESGLRNLDYGDLDSVGLFQQRPSQGWGRPDQLTDPVYAATVFYQRLRQQPNWQVVEVAQAAQLVQRSAAPDAYAQWEPQARATAAALTGAAGASLTCHNVVIGAPASDLVATANRELGTAALSGPQPAGRGRALANWLVAHAVRLAIDRVSYDGRTWTPRAGGWENTGPSDGRLSLHQATLPT